MRAVLGSVADPAHFQAADFGRTARRDAERAFLADTFNYFDDPIGTAFRNVRPVRTASR